MKNILVVLYGIISYLIGLFGLVAFILFVGGWSFLPIHINSSSADSTTMQAVLINLLLLGLFGLHHSVAARPGFKEMLNRVFPAAAERSSYVLVSGLFLFAICLYWQPLAGTVWSVSDPIATLALQLIHILGWLIAVAATFEIDHFHLMGLKQSLAVNTDEDRQLKEKFLYRMVRHPIQTGILIGVWFTPHMSMTQIMLSLGMTVYIFIGLYYEERSLEAHFGDEYRDYKKRVPGVIPFWPTK